VKKVVSISKEVTQSIQDIDVEILEAITLHQALRKVFGWKEEEDIFSVARKTWREIVRMKRELRVYQEER